MLSSFIQKQDIDKIPSPCYILHYESLLKNLKILQSVAKQSDCKILVALKGYSFWRCFEDLRDMLDGATCSGLYEARLAYEEIALASISQNASQDIKPYISQAESTNQIESIDKVAVNNNKEVNNAKANLDKIKLEKDLIQNKEYINAINLTRSKKSICIFSPAYKKESFKEILTYATEIIFNSFNQWSEFKEDIALKNDFLKQNNLKPIEVGIRINPSFSKVEPLIYNPCAKKSRLGITKNELLKALDKLDIDIFTHKRYKISGLHFHTHCEQDSSALQETLEHVKKDFGFILKKVKWVNFGGGHHITRKNYDINLLVKLIKDFKKEFNVEVILEPGEAVGWEVGDLFGSVIDIIQNDGDVAILDISASNHMPDCLEMPYRPSCYKIGDSKISQDKQENGKYKYRICGPTCLSGDIIGDYSFEDRLKIGDKIIFKDMIHYTIVKNTTFNGIELPSLGVIKDDKFSLLKSFGYEDFKNRN